MGDFEIDTAEIDALNKELERIAKNLKGNVIKDALTDTGKYMLKTVEKRFRNAVDPNGKPWPQIKLSSYIRRSSGNKGDKGKAGLAKLREELKANPDALAPSKVKPFSTFTGAHAAYEADDASVTIRPTRAKANGTPIVAFAHPPRLSGEPKTTGKQPERISFELVEKDAKEILGIFDRAVERTIAKAGK